MTRTRVFVVSSGLGHTKRGFESFAQECFEALAASPELDVHLFQAHGPRTSRTHSVSSTIPRDSWLAQRLGSWSRLRHAYFVEQLSFSLGLIPFIIRTRPDVILFSDWNVGNILRKVRPLLRGSYKLLYSNGGPSHPPFRRWDLVHQVTDEMYQMAIDHGEPRSRHVLIPYGISLHAPPASSRRALKVSLGIPTDRPVVVSVGALNVSHKRMDYVIREVSAMPRRPYLLLLGQKEVETPRVEHLAAQLLDRDDYRIATVEPTDVARHLHAADAFVLASITEGFGRATAEALGCGVACVIHDSPRMRNLMAAAVIYADMTVPGELRVTLDDLLSQADSAAETSEAHQRRQYAEDKFGWDGLRERYVGMLLRASSLEPGTGWEQDG